MEWVFKRDLISLGEELQYTIELTMEEQRRPLYTALMNQSSALTLMYCIELIESQGSFSLKPFLDRIGAGREGKNTLCASQTPWYYGDKSASPEYNK